MKLWNPVAFFISLIMSIVMALIFSYPQGMPVWLCFTLWPVRWPVAYFFANFICNPLGFKLAVKVFNFNPQKEYSLVCWNLQTFFDATFDGNEYTEFKSPILEIMVNRGIIVATPGIIIAIRSIAKRTSFALS